MKGMFHLKDPTMNPDEIFPRNMGIQPCPPFLCRGIECSIPTSECTGKHWFRPDQASMQCIESIGDRFLRTKHGWFNAFAFRSYQLKPKYKALLGDEKGPFPPGNQRT